MIPTCAILRLPRSLPSRPMITCSAEITISTDCRDHCAGRRGVASQVGGRAGVAAGCVQDQADDVAAEDAASMTTSRVAALSPKAATHRWRHGSGVQVGRAVAAQVLDEAFIAGDVAAA